VDALDVLVRRAACLFLEAGYTGPRLVWTAGCPFDLAALRGVTQAAYRLDRYRAIRAGPVESPDAASVGPHADMATGDTESDRAGHTTHAQGTPRT
jgi:hypothetical protein